MALEPDGKIILAGAAALPLLGPSDFALARYIPAPQVTWYYDADLDSYGTNANTQVACFDPDCVLDPIWGITCPGPDNWVLVGGDCADNDATIYPGATEICNAKDDNCDGNIDEGVSPLTWYRDADFDGYGADDNSLVACTDPSILETICDIILNPGCIPMPAQQWVTQAGDCNDNDASIHPGATETCNAKDDDCDGSIDEGIPTQSYYTDADGDGYGTGTAREFCSNPGTGSTTVAGDCNDNNAAVHPSSSNTTELCDGVDNDCDGLIDEGCSGKPVINISDAVVYESEGNATITISLSHITTLAVKINYTTSNGTAMSTKKEKDYKSIGNTSLTIPPGTLSATITVPVYNDGKTENNEYF